jgi:hypothetical protein
VSTDGFLSSIAKHAPEKNRMPELAYIDPGSGSLIIQGAIASIVAVVVFFRGQIARLIPGRRQDEESTTSTSTTASSVDDAAKGG